MTPLVGSSFEVDVVVDNKGPEAATETVVYGYLSDSLELTNLDPACKPDGYGGFSCALGEVAPSADVHLSLTVERVLARDAWTSFSVSSSNYDSNYDNNYKELYFEPDTSNPADVGVTIDAPPRPEVGEKFAYTIEATNHGPQQASRVLLNDSLPPGVDFISWSASDSSDTCELREDDYYDSGSQEAPSSYVYRELACSLGSLPTDERATIKVRVQRNDPYELWSSAWIATSSYDENYENDYASASTAPDSSVTSDLSTTVEVPPATPLVDESFETTFTVGNEGPAPAPDSTLSGYFGDGVFFESARSDSEGVTCSANGPYGGTDGSVSPEPATGGGTGTTAPSGPGDGRDAAPSYYGGIGFNCSLGPLAPGDSVDVVVSLTRLKAREMWFSASAWSSNFDPNYDDNYAEGGVPADASHPADVGVSIGGPDDAEVGDEVVFTIKATNLGPMDARSVVLGDSLPYGLEYVSASSSDPGDSCSLAGGGLYGEATSDAPYFWGNQELRCDLGSMGAGESTAVTLTTTRTTEYEIWNSAYVETASYDANSNNDYDSVALQGEGWSCSPKPAGTSRPDDIAVYDCPVIAGAGSDSVVVQADSTSRNVDIATGSGRDAVTVNVSSGSARDRRIEVKTGRGPDDVTIVVAPGITNATVFVSTGRGSDHVTIDAPRLGRGLRIIVIGGRKGDMISPYDATVSMDRSWPVGVTLRGGFGIDTLIGGYANDRLLGGRGADFLEGAGGDDVLQGDMGVDTCSGGPGTDTLKSC